MKDAPSYRYFFLSFAAAFLVLSLLFLFLMTTVHPKTPEAFAELPQEAEPVYTPTAEDALTVLFICNDTGSTTAGGFILARFDPVAGAIPIVVLPPETMVQNRDKTETLGDVFRYGGASYARDALADTLGVPVDRYVRMGESAFVTAANTIGTVEYDLPEALLIRDASGATITMSAGKQLLDGQKALWILTHDGYEGGALARCRAAGELVVQIANQRIDIVNSSLLDKVFEKIVNLVDTDISYTDYDNRKQAAAFMAQLEKAPARSLPISGRWNGEQTQLTLSDTFLAQLLQAF